MDHDRLSWNHWGALHSSSTGPTFELPAQWGPGRKHQPPSCRSVVLNGASVCSPSACATEGLADMPLLPVHSTRIVLGAQLPEPGRKSSSNSNRSPGQALGQLQGRVQEFTSLGKEHMATDKENTTRCAQGGECGQQPWA